jgi:hypothetical protein
MASNADDVEDGTIENFDQDDSDETETDDGGTIVKLDDGQSGDEQAPGEADFYRNLAEEIPETDLDKLSTELLRRIEADKQARMERDKKYEEGIKRTGLGDEAPGGAAFVGASTAVHPMLTKATVYYQSHTIGELMPPTGVVRDDIIGTVTPDRVAKAQRKVAHMNWQFRVQMPEFRSQLEKLLSQQPLGGSQYMRLVYDSTKRRPVPTFVPLDDVYIPEAAGDFYSAERRTYVERITQAEFEARVRTGYYRKVDSTPPPQKPESSGAREAADKVEGKDPTPQNEDGLRTIYVVEALAEIEDSDDDQDVRIAGELSHTSNNDPSEAGPRPYLIEIDPNARKIVRLVRNWEEKDNQFTNMCWMVDFEFIPWRGAQSVGLIHLAGSLAGSASGALRALLDSAHVNNLPTLLRLKGANTPGQTLDLNVCQVTEIEGSVTGDADIRKLMMAIPFNPPSTMLYELLGFLTEQGEALVRTTFDNLQEDGRPDMPVGTTLALIEQGLKVLSAIHGRLHAAMDRVIGVLHRINRLYITDEEILDDTGEMLAYHADYEGPKDVLPVSDPQVFSDVQRFAQIQVVAQRAQLMPQIYDLRKVEELILERTKLPNATDLLLPKPEPKELNAVNENVAATLGQPIIAFPDQDHLAHLQVHLDFLTSPYFGFLSIIAPTFIPKILQHLKEHIVYWYVSFINDAVTQAAGADAAKLAGNPDPGVQREMDKTLAAASKTVVKQAMQTLSQIPPIIQKAQQVMQQFAPPQPMDPGHAAIQTAQIKAQSDAQKTQMQAQQSQQENQTKQQQQQSQQQAELQQTILEQQGANQRTQAEIEARQQINQDDNSTALEIAAAKVEEGRSTNISTGTGLEGHSGPGAGGFGGSK